MPGWKTALDFPPENGNKISARGIPSRPKTQIARELGIYESLLKRWQAQLEGR